MTDNKKQESDIDSTVDSTPVTPDPSTIESNEALSSNSAHEQAKVKKPFKPRVTNSSTATSKSLLALSFIMSATAISASIWLYQQTSQQTFQQDISQIAQQQNVLASELKRQSLNQSQISSMGEQVTKLELAGQSQQAEFLSTKKIQDEQLQSLDAKLNRLSKTTKEDWKLAEADYLIRLANQRLLLESDNKSAVTLLSNADTILNELKDPIVFDTRKALAKDIQALQAINEFDLEGAYLKISALYESVASLPQREPSKEWQSSANAGSQSTATQTDTIKSTLSSFWQAIQSLVVINYHNKPIKTLLPPAQYQELIAGLQLQLDVAQVALIKGESTIYQTALARIANAITEHFDTNAESTVSFLSSLTAMQQINPSPELPQPRGSLVAMKSLMAAWIERDDLVIEPSIEPTVDATSTTASTSSEPNTSSESTIDNTPVAEVETTNKADSSNEPTIEEALKEAPATEEQLTESPENIEAPVGTTTTGSTGGNL
ncbi:uroporphyrinogen-III C-methyltransferase [Marinomonas sp. C2222]|uniref:Uroporphyrinogen-III C-methyltransferase n=1 Tax=Marinomonas sargassi TaxID=2984494 RepID=A0ABT2YUZ4_9GAMM|nr:uroporphyrinogen-III C-methyltransferase [Marinomonas sargassi]MCV2403711.1 uroporphyrinogen-III C-methyltransferase [Marinomonas sargassi]